MIIPQKSFPHLLAAVLAVGGLSCPCPGAAAGEAAPHAQHDGRHAPDAVGMDGCEHSACVTECEGSTSGKSREDVPLTSTGKPLYDDAAAVAADAVARDTVSRWLAWTGPPPPHVRLPQDTPVRRFDRLLD